LLYFVKTQRKNGEAIVGKEIGYEAIMLLELLLSRLSTLLAFASFIQGSKLIKGPYFSIMQHLEFCAVTLAWL